MKLGDVLRKERERREISTVQAAEALGVSVEEYGAMEAGEDAALERLGGVIVRFNELVGGQVNQLFYPCGLPFRDVRDYNVVR